MSVDIELVEVVQAGITANFEFLGECGVRECYLRRRLQGQLAPRPLQAFATYRTNSQPSTGLFGDVNALNDSLQVAFPLLSLNQHLLRTRLITIHGSGRHAYVENPLVQVARGNRHQVSHHDERFNVGEGKQ